MNEVMPLEVLFLTNFSDACYRAIPALAQMSDELEMRLTILHAADPYNGNSAQAAKKLKSFFPEADAYRSSRREVVSGPVIECVKRHCKEHRTDLIVAPCSDPLGWPRLGVGSVRARLLSECGVPVWTMGQNLQPGIFNRKTQNVGCWVDLDKPAIRHVSLAFQYAATLGARLHLLHTIPEIGDNSLTLPLSSVIPLHEATLRTALEDTLGWMPVDHQIHVDTGREATVMPRMVRELQLDILFAGEAQALHRSWVGTTVSTAVRRCTCPVVYSSADVNRAAWDLSRGAAFDGRKTHRWAA